MRDLRIVANGAARVSGAEIEKTFLDLGQFGDVRVICDGFWGALAVIRRARPFEARKSSCPVTVSTGRL